MNNKNLQTNTKSQLLWLAVFWLACAMWLIFDKWGAIQALQLVDTDDNLRLQQVRDWIAGQPWYDVRQYRLSPPGGADMHWSRVVDLPLAGLIALLSLFGDVSFAERWAVAIAPLLALGVALAALLAVVRQLGEGRAWLLVPILLLSGPYVIAMMSPLRIDHHGWQLALLAVMVFGVIDAKQARGGALAGVAIGLSLAIGIELLPFLGLVCLLIALGWILAPENEARRLLTFGAAVSASTAFALIVFIPPQARFAPYCDALSGAHLLALTIGGAGLVGAALLQRQAPIMQSLWVRVAYISALGFAVIAALWAVYPQCLADPSAAIDADAKALWLSNVREARPIYRQSVAVQLGLYILSALGIFGSLLGVYRSWQVPAQRWRWLVVLAFALFGLGFCFFQTRAAAAAQLLAIPGAAFLVWALLVRTRQASIWLLILAVGLGGALLSSKAPHYLSKLFNDAERPSASIIRGRIMTRQCGRLSALQPLNAIPAGVMFTSLDLSPRLLVATHHSAIAGPYHRNGRAIADVMQSFGGDFETAYVAIMRYQADYVLLCPGVGETGVYVKRAPNGFYARLARGDTPDWLEPVALSGKTPYRLWRVRPQ